MAAGDMTVDGWWATIEADETVRKLTILDSMASLCNAGSDAIFLSMTGESTIPTDGLQHNGVVSLAAGDSIPLSSGCPFIKYCCASGKTSKLWYIPLMG